MIIPTIGRPSLIRLLETIPDEPEIEVIVVGDTYNDDFSNAIALAAREIIGRTNIYWHGYDGGVHRWGHPQRNHGMSIANGEWLMFTQDDNIYSPNAFEVVRNAINKNYPRPLLFKIMTWQAGIVWNVPILREGDIDADCIVIPNVPEKLSKWSYRYNGDADFIMSTCELWDNDIAWRPEIIATALPNIERHPE